MTRLCMQRGSQSLTGEKFADSAKFGNPKNNKNKKNEAET